MSSIRPLSLSFTYTPAVICMAETRTIPSLTPLLRTISSTWGVRCTYARCVLVWNVRYSVRIFIARSCVPEIVPQARHERLREGHYLIVITQAFLGAKRSWVRRILHRPEVT